jgi:4a-hydroxytetrahydrobiopterin dehydratase
MTTADLANQQCVPCRGGVPPVKGKPLEDLLHRLGPNGWRVEREHHLVKRYEFPDFVQALAFVNKVGAEAERQGHHPNIFLTWGKVELEIYTHKIDGLTESDFVLAAKCDRLLAA